MKPAYVSVEFWRKDREDTATIEGWLTTDFLETRNILITPNLDYEDAITKIAISWDKVISITPAQSVREYQIDRENIIVVNGVTPELKLAIDDWKRQVEKEAQMLFNDDPSCCLGSVK